MHHFYLTKGSEKCFHVLPHTYSLGIISTSWITLCICYCIGCISTLYPTQFKLRPDLGEDHSRSWHSSYLYFKRAVQPVNFVHFSQVDNITEIFCKPNCQTRFTELKTLDDFIIWDILLDFSFNSFLCQKHWDCPLVSTAERAGQLLKQYQCNRKIINTEPLTLPPYSQWNCTVRM